MSEHDKHTEFLRHCLSYDDSTERHQMMEQLNRLERDLRIVQRAIWLAGVLIGFSLALLTYPTLLIRDVPYNLRQSLMHMIFALLVGLMICFVVFMFLRFSFCRKLNRQREACRQFLVRLLASRLGPTA